MHRLRNALVLARLVLAWFALSIGMAVAAPMVQSQSLEFVCSGGGVVKLVVQDADGKPSVVLQKMDCPLCATPGAPCTEPGAILQFKLPSGQVLLPDPQTRIAALTAQPPPARGPPPSAFA